MTAGLLHHVELYVSDLDHSAEFWRWFLEPLGYKLVGEWEQGVELPSLSSIRLTSTEPMPWPL